MSSSPIISWEIDGETVAADGDCNQEIKRDFLLGRKVMSNLDSIFKSRDITLPTKVHLVKAMVFPVVMYGCESWTNILNKAFSPPLLMFNYHFFVGNFSFYCGFS